MCATVHAICLGVDDVRQFYDCVWAELDGHDKLQHEQTYHVAKSVDGLTVLRHPRVSVTAVCVCGRRVAHAPDYLLVRRVLFSSQLMTDSVAQWALTMLGKLLISVHWSLHVEPNICPECLFSWRFNCQTLQSTARSCQAPLYLRT